MLVKLLLSILILIHSHCYIGPMFSDVPNDILKESLDQINIKYRIQVNEYLGTYLFQKLSEKVSIYNLYLWFRRG